MQVDESGAPGASPPASSPPPAAAPSPGEPGGASAQEQPTPDIGAWDGIFTRWKKTDDAAATYEKSVFDLWSTAGDLCNSSKGYQAATAVQEIERLVAAGDQGTIDKMNDDRATHEIDQEQAEREERASEGLLAAAPSAAVASTAGTASAILSESERAWEEIFVVWKRANPNYVTPGDAEGYDPVLDRAFRETTAEINAASTTILTKEQTEASDVIKEDWYEEFRQPDEDA